MRDIDLTISGGTVVTMDADRSVIPDGAVAIDGGKIIAVGNLRDILSSFNAKEKVIARDRYIFPGLINTHTHLFQTLLKGLAADQALIAWLERLITPVMPLLTPEDCYYAALLGIAEAIRSGTTTLLDFMYLTYRPEFSEAVLEAAQTAGVRFIFGRGLHDTGVERGISKILIENVDSVLAEVDQLRKKYDDRSGGLSRIWLAPSVMWSMTHSGLVALAEYANHYHVPITMHLMEATYDIEICAADYGKRPLEVLEETGALDGRFLLVHGVQLNDLDLRLMFEHGIAMSHCMAANLYLGSGIAPITKIHPSLPVSLGTDGAASNNSQNMIELLKLTALVHKGINRDPSIIGARRIMAMATCEGAQALGLQSEIGCLAPGYRADLFVVDANLPTSTPVNDIIATMVYSSDQENVQTVIIDGKVIMKDRKILSVNEDEVIRKTSKIAKRIIKEL